MIRSRLDARFLAYVLLTAVLCAVVLVKSHTHVDGNFRPDCPACQHERTVGTSSAAVSVATGETVTVMLGLAVDLLIVGVSLNIAIHQSSPRSPPVSL